MNQRNLSIKQSKIQSRTWAVLLLTAFLGGSFSQAATIGVGTAFGAFLDKDSATLTTGGVSVGFFTKELPTAASIASLNNISPISFSTFQTVYGYVDVRTLTDSNGNLPTYVSNPDNFTWDFTTAWSGATLTVPGSPSNAPSLAYNHNDTLAAFAAGSTGTALWALAYNAGNYANGYAGSTQWAVVTATAPGQSLNDWIYPSSSENIQLSQINATSEVIVGTDIGNSNIYLVIPEPSTAMLLVPGFLLLVALRNRASATGKNSLVKAGVLILAGILSFAVSGHAQGTVSTPIVGFQKIPLPVGGKAIAPTFIKANVYQGTATISGSSVTVASGALSGLSLGPTAFSNRANYPKYYVEVTQANSSYYGYNFDITAANTTSGFNSDNIPSGLSGSVQIAIRPHVTLNDLQAATLSDGDSVTLANDPSGALLSFYVYNGGWINSDFDTTKDFSHFILPPGTGLIYTGQGSSVLQLTLTGVVKSTPTAVPVYQNAYANLVAPVNPTTQINYNSQNIANGIGDGAAFSVFTSDGTFVEDRVYYSSQGGLLDSNFTSVSTANVTGGEAVSVGALSSDSVWLIPAAVNP